MSLFTSCDNPYVRQYAREKPDEREIVGTWDATVDSKRYMWRAGYSHCEPKIVVRSDGSVSIQDVPVLWHGFKVGRSTAEKRLETLQGFWELKKLTDEGWGISISFPGEKWPDRAMVLGQAPPHQLLLYLGDVDAVQVLTYARQ
jgi:hypothetical protein